MLTQEKKIVESLKWQSRLFNAMCLGTTATLLTANVMLGRELPKSVRASMSAMSCLSMVALAAKEKIYERTNRLEKAFDDITAKSLKRYLKAEEINNRIKVDIEQDEDKYQTVTSVSDPQLWGHWLTLAGLSHRIAPSQELTAHEIKKPANVTVNSQYVSFESEQPDLPGWMAEKLKNHLIVGVPGSGKGIMVSNALRAIAARENTTIFYVDPKNDVKEYGYVDGVADYIYRLPNGIVRSEPDDTKQWLEECLLDFEAYQVKPGHKKLLVLDELTAIITALKSATGSGNVDWLSGKVTTYCMSGGSEGIRYWGIGQAATNDMVGMTGGAKAQLVPIALINVDELPASQNLMAAQFVPNGKKLNSSEIKRICQQSPIGRAIYHGGYDEWFPIPLMENHSGFNRDNGQFVTSTESEECTEPTNPEPSDWYEELIACIQAARENSQEPTQAQIVATWVELTGRMLNQEGEQALMDILRKRGII